MATLKRYIANVRPVFGEVLEDLDALWVLKPRKNSNGVTVILPDEDTAQDMFDRAEDDPVNVLDQIQNYIVPEFLPSVTNWRSRSNIVNLHDRVVSIKRVTGSNITLNNETTIRLASDYSRGKSNTAVYFASGEVDAGGEEIDVTEEQQKKKNPAQDRVRTELYRYALVEDTFFRCAGLVTSFARYLDRVGNRDLVMAVLPLLDPCPVTTFLIMFEPGKGDRYFIDSDVIAPWWEARPAIPRNPIAMFGKLLAKCSTLDSGAYRSSNKPYLNAMTKLRMTLLQKPSAGVLVPAIDKAYNTLVNDNQIQRARNILPEATHTYLRARCSPEYNLKLAQDELRLRLDIYVESEQRSYAQMLKYGVSKLTTLPVFNDSSLIQTTVDKEASTGVMAFINSTYFLCIVPPTKSAFGGTPLNYSDASPDREDPVADPLAFKFDNLSDTPAEQVDMQDIVDNFDNIIAENGGRIPDELVSMFKAHIANNPSAPDHLKALVSSSE